MEFNFKQIEQMFNVDALVDQAEKSVASVLTYLPHAEVKETLLTLNKANANFARANLVASKSFTDAFKTIADDVQKKGYGTGPAQALLSPNLRALLGDPTGQSFQGAVNNLIDRLTAGSKFRNFQGLVSLIQSTKPKEETPKEEKKADKK